MDEQSSETGTKLWSVIVSIQNNAEGSRAKAHIYWPGKPLEEFGQAAVESADDSAAKISNKLAAARALSDLASQLFTVPASPGVATEPR